MEQAEVGSNNVKRNKIKAENEREELILKIQKKKEENSKTHQEISEKQKEITVIHTLKSTGNFFPMLVSFFQFPDVSYVCIVSKHFRNPRSIL